MIIAIIVVEWIACYKLAETIGVSDPRIVSFAHLFVGAATAGWQLAVHYLPRTRQANHAIVLMLVLTLFAGIALQGAELFPYARQTLLIAGIAVLPQLWWERYFNGRNVLILGLTGLVALPFGFAVWSCVNIGIVKVNARLVSRGEPYCLFVSSGRIFSSGYHRVPDNWSLSGWPMIAGRGAGGSGNCCQWDFHAMLLTQSDKLFNWSYRTQRFEPVSAQSRGLMALPVTCDEWLKSRAPTTGSGQN